MKITGEEFGNLIEKNPSWCKNLKEPLEITTFAEVIASNITHLSPLITFTGRDNRGWVARFTACNNLTIATGTFLGFVSFEMSGVKKIEKLDVSGENKNEMSASFYDCKNLKIATGTYKRFVSFSKSGVETIKDLTIKNTDRDGEKANFAECKIKYVPKQYRGKEFIFEKGTIESSIKKDRDDAIKETIKKIKSEANNIII